MHVRRNPLINQLPPDVWRLCRAWAKRTRLRPNDEITHRLHYKTVRLHEAFNEKMTSLLGVELGLPLAPVLLSLSRENYIDNYPILVASLQCAPDVCDLLNYSDAMLNAGELTPSRWGKILTRFKPTYSAVAALFMWLEDDFDQNGANFITFDDARKIYFIDFADASAIKDSPPNIASKIGMRDRRSNTLSVYKVCSGMVTARVKNETIFDVDVFNKTVHAIADIPETTLEQFITRTREALLKIYRKEIDADDKENFIGYVDAYQTQLLTRRENLLDRATILFGKKRYRKIAHHSNNQNRFSLQLI